jgi:hypothetical protein
MPGVDWCFLPVSWVTPSQSELMVTVLPPEAVVATKAAPPAGSVSVLPPSMRVQPLQELVAELSNGLPTNSICPAPSQPTARRAGTGRLRCRMASPAGTADADAPLSHNLVSLSVKKTAPRWKKEYNIHATGRLETAGDGQRNEVRVWQS